MSIAETGPIKDEALVHLGPTQKMLATAVIMLATIIVVLDQTIAVVVLPQMQAALGASPDTISWVLTSYILAGAVGTPLTGWLTGRFGRTAFFAVAILGFTISSMVCAMAVSLPMMVAARVVQGFFGAFMTPLGQTFLYDMNKPSKQVQAITIWGAGIIIAPIMGPVLGGYLAETFNWRWVFFINLPIGLLAGAGILLTMPKFPAIRRSFDHVGFLMIAIAICSVQLALDRGTQQDWLKSPEIIIELGLSAAFFWMLVFHLRSAKHPLIPIALFRNRNFNAAMLLSFIVMPLLLASSAMMPQLLQLLMGYPAQLAGVVMMPRAGAMLAGMLLGGWMMKRIDTRVQLLVGVLLIAWSMHLQTGFNLQMGSELVVWAGIIQGIGLGVSMTVVNFLAIASAPTELRTEAAAVYTLVRNTGTSIVIAISTALLAHNIQVNHSDLGSALQGLDLPMALANGQAGARIAAMADVEINRQAMMIAYINDFWLMMWGCILTIPLLLLVRPVRPARGEKVAMAE